MLSCIYKYFFCQIWEFWRSSWDDWQVSLWDTLLKCCWCHALPHSGGAFHNTPYPASEWQVCWANKQPPPASTLSFYWGNCLSLTWVFWSTDLTVLTDNSTLFLLPGRRSWTTPMMSRNLSQSSSTFQSSWRIKMVNWLPRIFSQKTVSVFFWKELLQPFVNAEEHLLFKPYCVI